MQLLEAKTLNLSKDDLMNLWASGLINDTCYTILILKYLYQNEWATSEGTINIDSARIEIIKTNWAVLRNDKYKSLSQGAILKTISKLSESAGEEIDIQLSIEGMQSFMGLNAKTELEKIWEGSSND